MKRVLPKYEDGKSSTYDTVSDVLDFVPIVGGANRFIRGEIKDGIIDIGLDFLGPIKYLAKGAKGVKMLKNAANVYKNTKKASLYDKAADRLAKKLEVQYANGADKSIMDEGSKKVTKLVLKGVKFGDKSEVGKKVIKNSILYPLVAKGANYLSNNIKIALAGGIHSAIDESNTKDALKQALNGAWEDYKFLYKNTGDPGDAFLLDDRMQERFMKELGYFKTDDEDGIKKIKRATDALKKYRGSDKINIYLIGQDEISRDSVFPIEEWLIPYQFQRDGIYKLNELRHAGNYPTIYYKHINPNKQEYYYRDIDLNDYGKHMESSGSEYGPIQHLADIYDMIGNPFILKTGITKIRPYDLNKYKEIHLLPNNNIK